MATSDVFHTTVSLVPADYSPYKPSVEATSTKEVNKDFKVVKREQAFFIYDKASQNFKCKSIGLQAIDERGIKYSTEPVTLINNVIIKMMAYTAPPEIAPYQMSINLKCNADTFLFSIGMTKKIDEEQGLLMYENQVNCNHPFDIATFSIDDAMALISANSNMDEIFTSYDVLILNLDTLCEVPDEDIAETYETDFNTGIAAINKTITKARENKLNIS